MNNNVDQGKVWLRKRNLQRIALVSLCGAIGGFMGFNYTHAQNHDPGMSPISYVESIPLGWACFFSFLMIGLSIYNWFRFDEFERPRYDKSSSFALFSGLLIIPWYVASLQGILPTPNAVVCLFLIFGVKSVVHIFFEYKP